MKFGSSAKLWCHLARKWYPANEKQPSGLLIWSGQYTMDLSWDFLGENDWILKEWWWRYDDGDDDDDHDGDDDDDDDDDDDVDDDDDDDDGDDGDGDHDGDYGDYGDDGVFFGAIESDPHPSVHDESRNHACQVTIMINHVGSVYTNSQLFENLSSTHTLSIWSPPTDGSLSPCTSRTLQLFKYGAVARGGTMPWT